jgi:hypothetical protein
LIIGPKVLVFTESSFIDEISYLFF